MTAIVALAALIAGPVLCTVTIRRVIGRARAAHVQSREELRALVTSGESWAVIAGITVTAAAIGTLSAMAVWA